MNIPAIRSATEDERSRVIDLITLSFATDPLARWALPEADQYLRVMPRWVDAFAGSGLPHGATFVVDGLEGAAMWLPPGVESDVEGMMRIIDEIANEQTPDLLTVLEQMSGFHPSEACWYLPLIGVDPVMQGRGFGALLMRHATTRCDAEGTVAYLESSNPRNISLYLRHGFEVMGTIQVGSSPIVTPMIRHPQ
jgi:ribosomal protein S18 acetylase RimI-like enzyme